MPSRSKAYFLLAFTFLALLLVLPAQAAETSNSEFVIIREGDVLLDDLYAGAIKVTVEGTIDGDLIAFAGEEVVINGVVTGSVFAAAPRVEVNGSVGGSVRMSGGSLEVQGEVGHDIVAAAFEVTLGPASQVGGEVLAWTYRMAALGTIEGNIGGSQRNLDLAGTIGGDVEVTVNRLVVVDPLVVGGDLGYRSPHTAEGLDDAEVVGAVVHKEPLPPNIRVRALGLLARFLVIVFLTLVALSVSWGWPDRTSRAIEGAGQTPVKAWGLGAVVLATPLMMGALTGLVVAFAPASASFPLLAILAPLVIAAFGVVAALSVVAGVPAVGFIGRSVFRNLGIHGSVLAGSVVAGLVWLLPFVGWLVPLIVLPIGLGSWALGWKSSEPATTPEPVSPS